jgi:predicted porin
MKKTLILLAACGAATGVCAQSSVTIYGVIDQGFGRLNKGTSFLTGLPAGLVGAPGVNTMKAVTSSRLGFRGSEDMGDGLRANFSIEHRFAPDIGSIQFGQTGFFGGHSWVGLSKATWGEIRLGRQFVPAHYVAVAGDPWGFDYTAASAYAFNKGGSTFTYAANSVGYKTPAFFGGLTSEVVYGFREGGTAENPANNANNVISANVLYNRAPWYAGVAFSKVHSSTATKNEYWVLTAAYDLGIVRPILSYSGSRANAVNMTHGFTLGAVATMGQTRVKAVYARLQPPGSNNETNKFGIGADYAFSKRTSTYVNAGTADTKGRTRSTGYDIGIKHLF